MSNYTTLRKYGSNGDQFISSTNNYIYVLRGEIIKTEDDDEHFNHRGEILIYNKYDSSRTNKYFDHNGKQQKHIVYGSQKFGVDNFVTKLEKLHTADEKIYFRLSSEFVSYIKNTILEKEITHIRFFSRDSTELYFGKPVLKKRVFVSCFDYRSFLTDYVSVREKNLTIFEERLPQTVVGQDFSFTLKSLYFDKMKQTNYEVFFLENNTVKFVNSDCTTLMMNQNVVEPIITIKVEKEPSLVVSTLLSPKPELDTLFD